MNTSGNPTGRPLLYAPEKVAAVLALYEAGNGNLTECCELCGVKVGTFLGWVVDDHEGLAERYTRAQAIRALLERDKILPILDDGTNDYVEKQTRNGSYVALDSEHIRRSEMRAGYRERMADRFLPKSLGGKSDADHSGTIIVKLDDTESKV